MNQVTASQGWVEHGWSVGSGGDGIPGGKVRTMEMVFGIQGGSKAKGSKAGGGWPARLPGLVWPYLHLSKRRNKEIKQNAKEIKQKKKKKT